MRNRGILSVLAAVAICAAGATASPRNGLDKNTVSSSEQNLEKLAAYFQDTADAIGGLTLGASQGAMQRIYRGDQDAHLGFTWTEDYGEYRVLVPREDTPGDQDSWLMINLKPKGGEDDLSAFEVGVVACDGGTTIVLEKGARIDVQIDRDHHLAQVSWHGRGVSGGQKQEFEGKLLARIAFKGESAIFAWREE